MNKLKIHPRDLEENRLVLARAEKLHRETTGYIREQIDSRVQYFNYYLGRQDVLSINKGQKTAESVSGLCGGAVSAGGGI